MALVRLTVTHSECRCGYCKKGDEFIIEDVCPPLCMELWHAVYPYVFALRNGTIRVVHITGSLLKISTLDPGEITPKTSKPALQKADML